MKNNCLTKIVLIGGGSGLSVVLKALKSFDFDLSAIVTMTDDGKSSGRLRNAVAVSPPGDIRKCITALASDEELLKTIFEYRFRKIRGLNGHSLGNLILVALTEITGSFDKAIEAVSSILQIKGKVIPSTFEDVRLAAKLENRQVVLGEDQIPIMGHKYPIDSILMIPEKVRANPKALKAIKEADYLIIGPGSLFTSVLSNFLISDIQKAVQKSKAKKIFICNVSTERGETEGYSVGDHYQRVREYTKLKNIDYIIVNNKILSTGKEGALGAITNISIPKASLNGSRVILTDLIDKKHPLYHSCEKLKRVLGKIILSPR